MKPLARSPQLHSFHFYAVCPTAAGVSTIIPKRNDGKSSALPLVAHAQLAVHAAQHVGQLSRQRQLVLIVSEAVLLHVQDERPARAGRARSARPRAGTCSAAPCPRGRGRSCRQSRPGSGTPAVEPAACPPRAARTSSSVARNSFSICRACAYSTLPARQAPRRCGRARRTGRPDPRSSKATCLLSVDCVRCSLARSGREAAAIGHLRELVQMRVSIASDRPVLRGCLVGQVDELLAVVHARLLVGAGCACSPCPPR